MKTEPKPPPSPPGSIIFRLMNERSITVRQLSDYLGIQWIHTLYLLDGLEPVTDEKADLLSKLFGQSKEFWLERERQYREALNEQSSVS